MKTAWWYSRPARKVLTPLHRWWHRHRPWPLRERVFELPSHLVAAEEGTRIIVLAAPDEVADAAWTARSFLHRLDRAPAGRMALDLYLDSPDAEWLGRTADRWTRLFPGSEVYATWEAVDKIAPLAPTLATLAQSHAAARRFAVQLHAQERDNVIYADADVLLLNDAPELADAVRNGGPALYARAEDGAGKPDAGLLYLPRGGIPVAEAETLLAGGDEDFDSIGGTLLARLLGAMGARPLPPERYLVSAQGGCYGEADADYGRLAARRFVAPGRHLMYARGLPLLWSQWHEKSL